MGIIGTDQILPTGAAIVRPFRTATLRIGPPIEPAASGYTRSTNRARRAITDQLMSEITRLTGQHYDDHYATLPAESLA